MKNFSKLLMVAALAVITATTAWAQTTSTLTFTAKCNGSGTADDGAAWTVASDANESSFDNNKGIHYGTGSAAVSYLNLSTSDIDGTITQIVVNASGASGTSAKLDVTVGGSAFGTQKSLTASAANYTLSGSASGEIVVAITQSSAKKAIYCKSITVTYTPSGTSLNANDLTLNAVSKSFDLADGEGQTFQLTNSGSADGALSYQSSNTAVATVSNTGLITAVNEGTATITVTQAASSTYQGGSATCTVTITDSRYSISNLTFSAACGGSGTADDGQSWTITSDASESTFDSTSGIHYGTNNASVTYVQLTSSSNKGTIKKVVVNARDAQASGNITVTVGGESFTCGGNTSVTATNTSTDYIFTGTGSGEIVVRVDRGSSNTKAIYVKSVKVSYFPSTDPQVTANNVDNLAYNATAGQIAYTINNPVAGGSMSASTTADWITVGSDNGSAIEFTCTANSASTSRSATVTLTYTYNTNETVTKDVTVTQAAAPVIYSTIPTLFAAATSSSKEVHVTFSNWVVSGVSTNGKNVFVTDNNGNGFVIFDNGGGLGNSYAVGNILSGTDVTCNLVLYNGFAEITGLDVADLTITAGGTVSAANVAMASLAGINTGALVSYDELTCSIDNSGSSPKYFLSDGTTSLQVYNTLYSFSALEEGKTYNITGIYQQYNSTKEILPRSSADIEEVVNPVINASSVEIEYDATVGSIAYTISNPTGATLQASCTADWVSNITVTDTEVNFTTTTNSGNANREATFTLTYSGAENKVVTVTQKYFIPDYADLPFAFNGGRADIANTTGLTQDGLDSDYGSSPKLKFNGTGDWVILKFNEQPGVLTFDLKGNSFSDGTFKVQTSSDGVDFVDLKVYNNDNFNNDLHNEEFDNLNSNVRYIKWIYTNKVNGNVALGNITLAAYAAPTPSITLSSYTIDATAAETNGTLNVTYSLVETDLGASIYWYTDNTGNTTSTEPDWISAEINATTLNVDYVIGANTGAARTAYFKVYGVDGGTNDVYSELVTVTQAAYEAPPTPGTGDQYKLFSGTLVEGDYIIYYNGSAMKNTENNDRLYYEEVTPDADIITTSDASIVWHIAPSGEYWTIYSPDVDSYAAGTGVKNKAQMLADGADDNAMWTVSGTETFEFVNKANADANVNANLRNNVNNNTNYGFACYATGTGGALSLYKRYDVPATIDINLTLVNGRYWTTFYNSAARYELPEGAQAFTMNASGELYRLGTNGRVIPMNTAVVIIADTASLELTQSDDTSAVTINGGVNILRGSNYEITVTTNEAKVLGVAGGIINFYDFTGTKIPAMKAYFIN